MEGRGAGSSRTSQSKGVGWWTSSHGDGLGVQVATGPEWEPGGIENEEKGHISC